MDNRRSGAASRCPCVPHCDRERRRDARLADLTAVCVLYFEVFGQLPEGELISSWGVAAILEPRIFTGRYRGWTLLPQ